MIDDDINLRFTTHEAVCTERWMETISRIKRLEAVMIGGVSGVIALLSTIAFRMG